MSSSSDSEAADTLEATVAFYSYLAKLIRKYGRAAVIHILEQTAADLAEKHELVNHGPPLPTEST